MKLVEASKLRKKYPGTKESRMAKIIEAAAQNQNRSVLVEEYGLDDALTEKLRKLGYAINKCDYSTYRVSW